jgi:hypothetical protein
MVSLIREVCGTSYDMRVLGLNGLGAFNPNVKDVGVFETFTLPFVMDRVTPWA